MKPPAFKSRIDQSFYFSGIEFELPSMTRLLHNTITKSLKLATSVTICDKEQHRQIKLGVYVLERIIEKSLYIINLECNYVRISSKLCPLKIWAFEENQNVCSLRAIQGLNCMSLSK